LNFDDVDLWLRRRAAHSVQWHIKPQASRRPRKPDMLPEPLSPIARDFERRPAGTLRGRPPASGGQAPLPRPPVPSRGTLPPVAPKAPVRTRWQPGSMPAFPIEPANDPIQHLADDDSTAMALLALVLCATLTLTLLGFGLQMWQ
jgi:hypothetical protein